VTASTSERLGVEAFQALFDRCSNWGRWGPDDERGTLNLITAEKRVQAAGLVREGATVSVSHPVNTVGDAENTSPAVHLMVRAGDVFDGVTVTSIADHLAVSPHGQTHSHLDALCHFAWQGKMYNGRPVTQVTSTGARANAITIGQDGIVSRGVLLDVPRQRGVEYLEPNQSITIDDLEATEAAAGLRVESGDILLVRTGRHVRRKARGPSLIREFSLVAFTQRVKLTRYAPRIKAPGTAEPRWPGSTTRSGRGSESAASPCSARTASATIVSTRSTAVPTRSTS
jgi:hypothetical protein